MKAVSVSHLRDDARFSVNVEGGQLTTDVRTQASEESVRRLLDRTGLLKKLDSIDKIDGGVKLVWNASTSGEMESIHEQVRKVAAQIAEIRV